MYDDFDLTEIPNEDALDGYRLAAEGEYHVGINAVEPDYTTGMGASGMRVHMEILAGTVAGQEKTNVIETFWAPSPSNKDGGAFLKKRMARLALATGLITAADLGKRVSIDWDGLEGRQMVVGIVNSSQVGADGRKYERAEINGLRMYYITDPKVAHVPKDAEAVASAPPPVVRAAATANGGAPSQPAPTPAPVADAYQDLGL